MIIHKKMSVFDAPYGSTLIHACNAQGTWNAGIAKEFKQKFPMAFEEYQYFCKECLKMNDKGAVGLSVTTYDNMYEICALITSFSYGKRKDTHQQIIAQTYLALDSFFKSNPSPTPLYSNKFNSGLFGIPWEETEKVLQYFVDRYKVDWTVCSND